MGNIFYRPLSQANHWQMRDPGSNGYASQAAAARAAPQRRAALAKQRQDQAARAALKRKEENSVRVRRFGDSALKQLPLKWLKTAKYVSSS